MARRKHRDSRRPIMAATVTLLLLATMPVEGQSRDAATAQVAALAVRETPEGLDGVSAIVTATALSDGTGQVFVSTKPLAATDMQGSARLAARVAAQLVGVEATAHDHLIEFRSGSAVIGGPSAGAVMTLALAVALHNVAHPDDRWTLDPRVAATGTINPDGTIGPVGGIPDKAEAAADAGITLFLYPAGLDVATTYEPGPLGLRPVAVDMRSHCAQLGITCRGASSVRELLEAAAGVILPAPDVPTPTTADYRPQLAPGVRDEVDELAARIDALRQQPSLAPAAAQPLESAQERLDAARAALEDDHVYSAATEAFQGHIQVGWAASLHQFHTEGQSGAVVESQVNACQGAAEDSLASVRGADDDTIGIHRLYADAAAEQRAATAVALGEQAETQWRQARRVADWEQALFTASFCIERAETARWWHDLGDQFGRGPEVSVTALLNDHRDLAREMAAYADAVSPGAGTTATARLEESFALAEEGLVAGAVMAAIEAEVLASVAMQTASTEEVPQGVLDAARQAAAEAIARARAQGVEPVLAVSLVELSSMRSENADALTDLWTARVLALLYEGPLEPPQAIRGSPWAPSGYTQETLLASIAVGMLAGGAVVAVAFGLWRPRI